MLLIKFLVIIQGYPPFQQVFSQMIFTLNTLRFQQIFRNSYIKWQIGQRSNGKTHIPNMLRSQRMFKNSSIKMTNWKMLKRNKLTFHNSVLLINFSVIQGYPPFQQVFSQMIFTWNTLRFQRIFRNSSIKMMNWNMLKWKNTHSKQV